MKLPLFSTCLLLCTVCKLLAQPVTDREVINFGSSAVSMCVTANQKICLATRIGEVALPGTEPNTWAQCKPDTTPGFNTLLIDNISFFNSDTGFVTGFMANGGKYNVYYRTINGGRRWERLLLPDDGWVDDAVNLNNGEAWLSVSGTGHIDYTRDFGLNWQQLAVPPGSKERFAAIFFNARRQGLMGSLYNVLAYTPNNCSTWVNIPTPLTQKAYNKTNVGSRPEINKTAIFKNYLLCMQEGLVFYTRLDNIHWQPLNNYNNFIASPNDDVLYLTTQDKVAKAGDTLQAVEYYTLPAGTHTGLGRYNNGTLAFWDGSTVTSISSRGIATTHLYTKAATNPPKVFATVSPYSSSEPVTIGYEKDKGTYGYWKGKIYTKKGENLLWVYLATLPFSAGRGSLELLGTDTLLYNAGNDTLTYYSLSKKTTYKTTPQQLLNHFCARPVNGIIFETGSSGCFHYYTEQLVYERSDGGDFELTDNLNIGSAHGTLLKGYNQVIDASITDAFVKNLPITFNLPPTLQALGLSPGDYAACKKDIEKFEQYVLKHKNKNDYNNGDDYTGFNLNLNNINFNRLRTLPDSVPLLPPARVDSFLPNVDASFSTTNTWVTIKLVTDNGEVLTITNTERRTSSLHCPWSITISGCKIEKNALSVNKFIDAVYPAFIQSKGHADIVESFVKQLYTYPGSAQ